MTVPAPKRAAALDLVRRGHSINDAAKRVGISRKTIARWLATEPAPALPQPEVPAAPREPFDPRRAPTDLTRTILDESLKGAELAKNDGNLTAAARLLKNAHGAAHDLQRAERESKASTEVVTIPRAELDRAKARQGEMLELLRADFDRCGLACALCARQIRVWFASGGAEGKPPLPVHEGSISPAQGIAILQALAGLVRHSRGT